MSTKNTPDSSGSSAINAAPNGHKNGIPANDPRPTGSAVTKRKKKKPGVAAKTVTAALPPSQEAETVSPTEEVPQEAAPSASTEIAQEDPPPAPEEPTEAVAPEPSAAEPAEPAATPEPGLKLRMKIWTDPATSRRYLMPTAFMRDVINGQPVSDVMYAYAMSDEDTKLVTLRAHEWNTLPFFYFQEIGPAPRASERPIDVVPAGPLGKRSP